MTDMVKRILLAVDDMDFERLKELKGDNTWEQFLLKPHLETEDK